MFSLVTNNIDDSSATGRIKFLAMRGVARLTDRCVPMCTQTPLNLDAIYMVYWKVSMGPGSIAVEANV